MGRHDKSEIRQTKTTLAKKLGISRGMLYYQHKQPIADGDLKENIEEVMRNNPSYGHKRIALELKLNKKRILRVMKKFHLMPKRRRKTKFSKPDDLGKPETKYLNLLEKEGITISMSRKSSPRENGYQESFYSGFKLDLGSTNHYQHLGELIEAVAQTIYYYNNQRIHTKLKTAPVKFRLDREYLFKEMGT